MLPSSSTAKRVARVGREVVWVGLGQGLSALGALVGVRLLTGVLDPEQYGELALGISVAAFVQMTFLQPLYEASLRFFSIAAETREMPAFLASVRRVSLFVTGVLFVGFLVVFVWLAMTGRSAWFGLALLSAIFSLLSGLNVTMNGIQNAARQRPIVAWHDSFSQWLRFLLAVLFVSWFGRRSDMAMLGYIAAVLAVVSSQYWFFVRNPDVAAARAVRPAPLDVMRWTRQLRDYAWPVAAWGVFMGAYLISGRWALQLLQTSTSVGLYAALYQLGFYPIVLLTGLWMVVIQPVMFGRAGAGTDPVRSARGRRLGIVLVVVTLVATLAATGAAALFNHRIFAVLVAPEYRGVSALLPLMILGSGFFACGQVVSLVGMIDPDTSRLIAPKVGASIIGTLANFFGAWRYGVDGVVYAGVLYGVIYFAWMTRAIAVTPAKRAALSPVSAR